MPQGDFLTLLIIGGVFLFLGALVLLWGYREEKRYFEHMASKSTDLREFVDHWPARPQPGSLKTGGWIAIAIGILLGLAGVVVLVYG